MKIGEIYKHKYIKCNCEILSLTAKGAKVKQTEGKKEKIAFYDSMDFENSGRGFWIKQ